MSHTMPKHIGDYNKNLMLSVLRERGPTSRVELSRILEISPTAITRNTTQLLKNGILRECGAEQSHMGRKPVLIELCDDFCYVLGADIVGGTIKTAIANLMGRIVLSHEEPIHRDRGANAVLEQLLTALRHIIVETGVALEKIWVVVVGTPGVFDPIAGKSRFTFFVEGWEDINVRLRVFEALSIETLIENDVNLDVIGESWKGVGKEYGNILYVKLGQGLAARIVLQNKLIRGENKMAGEIGYMMPGPSKSAENYENMLCNDAVSQRYRDITGNCRISTISDLCLLADSGDTAAKEVLNDLLEQFAVVLLNSAAVLDPQVIILGGDACSFKEKEITALKKNIESRLPLNQKIIPSSLNKKAALYGAIKIGLDRVEELITEIW